MDSDFWNIERASDDDQIPAPENYGVALQKLQESGEKDRAREADPWPIGVTASEDDRGDDDDVVEGRCLVGEEKQVLWSSENPASLVEAKRSLAANASKVWICTAKSKKLNQGVYALKISPFRNEIAGAERNNRAPLFNDAFVRDVVFSRKMGTPFAPCMVYIDEVPRDGFVLMPFADPPPVESRWSNPQEYADVAYAAIERMHSMGTYHGGIDSGGILPTGDGPVLVGFSRACSLYVPHHVWGESLNWKTHWETDPTLKAHSKHVPPLSAIAASDVLAALEHITDKFPGSNPKTSEYAKRIIDDLSTDTLPLFLIPDGIAKDTFVATDLRAIDGYDPLYAVECLWPTLLRRAWKGWNDVGKRLRTVARSVYVLELASSIIAKQFALKNKYVRSRLNGDAGDVERSMVYVDAFAVCATLIAPDEVDTFGFSEAVASIGSLVPTPKALASRCRGFLAVVDFDVDVPTACSMLTFLVEDDGVDVGRTIEYGLNAVAYHLCEEKKLSGTNNFETSKALYEAVVIGEGSRPHRDFARRMRDAAFAVYFDAKKT